MSDIVLFLEFFLLLFIAVAWIGAKRDLTATAAQQQAPAVTELQELRATIDQLLTVLEERASAAEVRLQALIDEANRIPAKPTVRKRAKDAPTDDQELDTREALHAQAIEAVRAAEAQIAEQPVAEEFDPYEQVFALVDSGVEDHAEIARLTGLGLSEVTMVLSVRPR